MSKLFKNALCVLSVLLSAAALIVSIVRNSYLDVDYPSLLVGVLSVLVAFLVGWNIYSLMDFNRRKKDMDEKLALVNKQFTLIEVQANTNRGLLEEAISNLYYHQLGAKHPIPATYFYLAHVIMAITTFVHIQQYDTCDSLIKGVMEVVSRPELVKVSESNRRNLLSLLSCVQDTQKLSYFPDLLSIVSRLGSDTH